MCEREGVRLREREKTGEKERVCVYIYVCVRECVRLRERDNGIRTYDLKIAR